MESYSADSHLLLNAQKTVEIVVDLSKASQRSPYTKTNILRKSRAENLNYVNVKAL